ncbi:MAG TPA: PilC/PilY family type IV pilus protein [Burkholderiales bacterium]|nr:PilC/PilY family type IV pilus protein [Burkholderiales bacterium]
MNLRRIFLLAGAIAVLLGSCLPAAADDTEIFTTPPTLLSSRPNVLIILDSSANWSADFGSAKKFNAEVTALKAIVGGLSSEVNLGLMLFAESGGGDTPSGSYVRYALRQMTGTNKLAFQNLMDSLDIIADKGANAPFGKALFEAFKYYGGGTGSPASSTQYGPIAFAGFGQPKRDYAGNTLKNPFTALLPGNAFTSSSSQSYVSPVSDGCAKNYVIFITNGKADAPGGDGGSPSASTLLSNVGGNTTTIPLPNTGAQATLADEYTRFLYNTDVSSLPGQQNIITYTVAVYEAPVNTQIQEQIDVSKSMANQGHGRYFAATDAVALNSALLTIFNEIQAVNSVFASVTLPVSVNVRGTNLNQVYMGVFRPDADSLPRWPGNLKEYKLAIDSSTRPATLFLADRNGLRAENQSTGFVVDDAVSYWTSSSTFWSFQPSGNPPSASDSPDGAVVEKGAVAQSLRTVYAASQTARKIYTCIGCAPGTVLSSTAGASTSFDPANSLITAAALTPSSATTLTDTERTALINWVRGQDNATDENLDGSFTDARASIHGDVLHSRPAVINYNRFAGDNDVVIFYGANDGMFRAVKGGTGATDGYEKWAFVPSEFYSRFKRLRDNAPAISAANPKTYFADGSVSVYRYDANGDGKLVAADGDKVYLFISMRRGGNFIYALDVSDPDAPKVLWNKTSTDTGYGELGQTWSEPKVVNIRASANPVLIFGAGYDAVVEDQDPIPDGTYPTKGRGILVVDATNGNVLWQAGPSPTGATVNKTVSQMIYSIPSDVAALDRNADGYIDRLYVGDTGGNVWRVDIGDASAVNWTVNKLATVGYDAVNNKTSRRKFLYPPDVVYGKDANGAYDTVLIGSGDREHPFNGVGDSAHPLSDAVTNRYYMFKDRDVGISYGASYTRTAITEANLYDTTANLIQVGTAAQQTAANVALTAAKGWYITLATGEKVVTSSITLAGITFFNTNQGTLPTPGVCTSNLGLAREYAVGYKDGTAKIDNDASGGLLTASDRAKTRTSGGYPPVPVAVVVQIDGKQYQAVISGTDVQNPPGTELGARIRTYWHKMTQ